LAPSPRGAPYLSSIMEKQAEQKLNTLIERGLFVQAEELARALGLEAQAAQLRQKAICQMAAVNRNIPGTKKLAEAYGLGKAQVQEILQQYLRSATTKEKGRHLEACYDQSSGDYLSFDQWMAQLFKRWDKIGN